MTLPRTSEAVVVGGGIVGVSLAYHLALRGVETLLVEQNRIAGGTTWHAAGMVGRLRGSRTMTRINQVSAELYARLEDETGVPTGWRETGSLLLAQSKERMLRIRRGVALANALDIEAEIVGTDFVRELWPLLHVDDLEGAAWIPGDGKVDPEGVTKALAEGARRRGATLVEGVRVTGLDRHSSGRVLAVKSQRGSVACKHAILCCGMWTRELAARIAAMTGSVLPVPLYPVEHHYLVSHPVDGVRDDLPIVRDPDGWIYLRPRGDSVLLGAFQERSVPWNVDSVPDGFSFDLLEPDWEKFEPGREAGERRLPPLADVGYERFVNGPESFTPDNDFLVGELPGARGLWVAAGFNSAGIACAGGVGKELAQWLAEGAPGIDLSAVDVRRFTAADGELGFLRDRVRETPGLHYALPRVEREFETGRDRERSPLHEVLVRAGACFEPTLGRERAKWFTPNAEVKIDTAREPELVEFFAPYMEQGLTRRAVVLFDLSAISKLVLRGKDALALLDRLCASDVDVAPGTIVRTLLLNDRGGIQSDVVLVRRGPDDFLIASGSARTVRDLDWISRHAMPGEETVIEDVTAQYGVVGVAGPFAARLLARVSSADFSPEGFPDFTAQRIDVGPADALALRVSSTGELGWELWAPSEDCVGIWEMLVEASGRDLFGKPDLDVALTGSRALEWMRMEMGHPAWGADFGPADTPLEAGLEDTVSWRRARDDMPFIGAAALLRQRDAGVSRRLLPFSFESSSPILEGNEPVYRDGRCVGTTTSGGFSRKMWAALCFAFVHGESDELEDDELVQARWEIDVAGELHTAELHLEAPYGSWKRRRGKSP